MNIFKTFWIRIKTDYQEWWIEWVTRWNTNRDLRQIDSAIRRAKERNELDHKTYYIIKDSRGAVNALTRGEILRFTRAGLFPKMNILQLYAVAIDIVTSNPRVAAEYINVQQKLKSTLNKNDEQSDKRTDRQ